MMNVLAAIFKCLQIIMHEITRDIHKTHAQIFRKRWSIIASGLMLLTVLRDVKRARS